MFVMGEVELGHTIPATPPTTILAEIKTILYILFTQDVLLRGVLVMLEVDLVLIIPDMLLPTMFADIDIIVSVLFIYVALTLFNILLHLDFVIHLLSVILH